MVDRHRSREFIAFLRQPDASYPPATKLRLDRRTRKRWPATCRFEFVFTPKDGLNIVESFFGKVARTLLRGVASKEELVERTVPTSNPLCSSGPAR